MDAGQGRTMAIASDTMWRWRFAAGAGGGASERAYHRFWSNALRWLVRDPDLRKLRRHPLYQEIAKAIRKLKLRAG